MKDKQMGCKLVKNILANTSLLFLFKYFMFEREKFEIWNKMEVI